MTILFLITARGGSKGVPRKNLTELGGLSVIGWKARAVVPFLEEGEGNRLVISTDDAEIAEDARYHGVEVPFMRPPELATDSASSASVITHALDALDGNFSSVMLLEPSAPFATTDHYRAALKMSVERDADLVVGMKATEPHSIFIGEIPEDGFITPILTRMESFGNYNIRRQDLKPEWTMNGALYLFSVDVFRRTGSIYGGARNYGLLMDHWHSIEIDSRHDLEMARYAVDHGYVAAPTEMIRARPW